LKFEGKVWGIEGFKPKKIEVWNKVAKKTMIIPIEYAENELKNSWSNETNQKKHNQIII
jgi:hypothetical protein